MALACCCLVLCRCTDVPRWLKLLEYTAIDTARFQLIERFWSFSPSAVTVSPAEPSGSARHRWPGTVTSLAPHGDAVRLLVSGRHELLADVTPAAVAELELAPGREVWLSVKETAVDTYDAEREGD